jgi:hypothetical protein
MATRVRACRVGVAGRRIQPTWLDPGAATEALVAQLFTPVIRAGDRLAVGAEADEAVAAAASRDRTRSELIIVFLVTSVLGIGLVV